MWFRAEDSFIDIVWGGVRFGCTNAALEVRRIAARTLQDGNFAGKGPDIN